MPAKRKAINKKKESNALLVKKPTRMDNVTKEEILVSLVWIAVLVAAGIILSGTRYATAVLTVVVVGLIGCLIVLNYEK